MRPTQAKELLERAIDAGLLPAGAASAGLGPNTEQAERPWPLLILTALGAWLAAVPLLGFTYTLLGDALTQGAAAYGVAALMLTGSVIILRSRSVALFLEQLALPALLVGGSTLALGLYRDLETALASALLMLAALGLAALTPKPWLRALLGAAAAVFFVIALLPLNLNLRLTAGRLGLISHAGMVLGVLGLVLQQRYLLAGQRAAQAAYLEAVGAGWLVMLAVALGVVAVFFDPFAGSHTEALGAGWGWGWRGAAMALALGGLALAAQAWTGLRRPLPLAVAVVLAGLCLWLPMLSGAMLLIAFACSTRRWRLAMAGAGAAVWVLASSYYQLSWSLSDKALVLLGAAALLALIAWAAARQQGHLGLGSTGNSASSVVTLMPGAAWLALAGLLGLGTVNAGIWQKQRLITEGRPIFVALAPVDPRSLLQGDYMRLNYQLGSEALAAARQGMGDERPHLVLKLDARGLGVAQRLHRPGSTLAPDEQLIELSPRHGGWTLVSDAWFFREGDGARWQAAKFGEFRVRADGQALLVGLADERLKRIE